MDKSNKLSNLRKQCNIDNCVKKYYKTFDFIDICETPMKFKKKEIAFDKINQPYYSVGYFSEERLIRFDERCQAIPQETYLLWDDSLVIEAHTYLLGVYKKTLKKPKLYQSFYYQYDSGRNLKRFIWFNHKDTLYGNHSDMTIQHDYEYDSKGLLKIVKTLDGTNWSQPDQFILYDREKEQFLKQFTVSKKSLINKASKINDGIIEFELPSKCKTTRCQNCEADLDYILTVHTQNIANHNNTSALSTLPVLFCLDCLTDQDYNINSLYRDCNNQTFMKDAAYRFVSTSDEEKIRESFLKIGGNPEWMQNDEHPICPTCGKPMVFVIEINSDESISNGKNVLMFGDLGKIYVFSCCDNVSVQMQCS